VKTRSLTVIVDRLLKEYGRPEFPRVTDPFEMILYENVAYLVSDDERYKAFEKLRAVIGTRPGDILTASSTQFESIAKLAGSNKTRQAAQLRRAAEIAQYDFNGNLAQILKRPFERARAALKKFPSIGEPGAEKILLFNRAAAVLALESNGLRVLTRIGFAEDQSSYAATYRTIRNAISPTLPDDHDWLIQTHQLLRKHGQKVCRRNTPLCGSCVIRKFCKYSQGVEQLDSRNSV
jgi:endonuclease-3